LPFAAVQAPVVDAVARPPREHNRPTAARNAENVRSFFMTLISDGDSVATEPSYFDLKNPGGSP